MWRRLVDSSCLRSIGYDPVDGVLEVRFVHGDVYQYHEVPADVHEAFMAAESKGRYLNAHLRDAFPYCRL